MTKPVQFKVTKCDLKQTNQIQQKIFVSRGLRVMLDSDLAKLYGVTTKQLNQQLKRNLSRFPKDFAFQLTLEEAKDVAAFKVTNCDLEQREPTSSTHLTSSPSTARSCSPAF